MLHLLEVLGFTDPQIIDKKRTKYTSDTSEFEICFDEITGLGTFVEIELLQQVKGDIAIGFDKIYEFLKSVGISQIDEQQRGYITMLWDPGVNFGRIRSL